MKHAVRAELLQAWIVGYKMQHKNVPGLLLRSVQDEIIKLKRGGEWRGLGG